MQGRWWVSYYVRELLVFDLDEERLWVEGHVDWSIGLVEVVQDEKPDLCCLQEFWRVLTSTSCSLDDGDDGLDVKKGKEEVDVFWG